MRKIQTDTELRRLHKAGVGLIYTDYSGRGPLGYKNNRLHAASCDFLASASVNIPKFFFNTLSEAKNWLLANRGQEDVNWKRCGTCHALGQEAIGESSNSVSQLTTDLSQADEAHASPNNPILQPSTPKPFTEGRVEDDLVPWLKGNGYMVNKRVRVSNGIIDLEATGPDGRWIIEAKGEDKGGYTSAEMNFQIGIGQIVSRMTEPTANYALAIPLTSDFQRVLRKFRGTTGFEKLRLTLFIVEETGTIHLISPTDVSSFLDTLQ